MAAGDQDTLDILAKLKMAKALHDPFQQVSPYDPLGRVMSSGTFAKAAARSLSWDDEKVEYEPNIYIKKYQINESIEDVLALATTWHRLRLNSATNPYPNIEGLTDPQLFKLVREEDRIMANAIRDYYSKKFMMWTLKEVKLTPFRTDMSKFICGNGKLFTEKTLPLVYRIPEFYQYDIAFAEMVRDLPMREIPAIHQTIVEAHNLRPLRKFDVKRKNSHKFEYWFKDENDHAVLITLDHLNSCVSLFEREFRKESMDMKLTGCITNRNDHSFFKVAVWKVE